MMILQSVVSSLTYQKKYLEYSIKNYVDNKPSNNNSLNVFFNNDSDKEEMNE